MGIFSKIFGNKLELEDQNGDDAVVSSHEQPSNVAENESGEPSPFLVDDEVDVKNDPQQ